MLLCLEEVIYVDDVLYHYTYHSQNLKEMGMTCDLYIFHRVENMQ